MNVSCNDVECIYNINERCELPVLHIEDGACVDKDCGAQQTNRVTAERNSMTANEIIPSLFGHGKNSTVKASERMGKSRGFISTYLSKGHIPKVDTMVEILDAIGYDVAIISRESGEITIIEPNE